MFNANFADAAYGASALTKSFSETGGTVTGNASVVMPMTIMRIFGQTERTIAVTRTEEMRIPNTDVMFVLDTTGSMSDNIPGDSASKIFGLRREVKCLHEALAKQDTEASCGSTQNRSEEHRYELKTRMRI